MNYLRSVLQQNHGGGDAHHKGINKGGDDNDANAGGSTSFSKPNT